MNMRSTLPKMNWTFRTVEWSPKLTTVHNQINATHFVLPDLPNLYSNSDKSKYLDLIPSQKRIQTISACNHNEKTLREAIAAGSIEAGGKILLVGGNEKLNSNNSCCALSTTQAAHIIRNESDVEMWGVTNPNDEESIHSVHEKIESGISGFITQPLLASRALSILEAYPRNNNTTFIAGIAMPKNNRNLQFWLKLLNQMDLESDPMFKSHMTFFQSPHSTSLEWIRRELQNLESLANIDGVHFMPINNIDDLMSLLPQNSYE